LLVEDDPSQSAIVRRWLERAGFRVLVAHCAEEGRRLAMTPGLALVLSDIELPGGSGIDLAFQVKRLRPNCPIALVTAHGHLDYAVEALRCGVQDFLMKPLNREFLLVRVEGLIEAARLKETEKSCSVLAIGAHPDDVEIGCGASLLRHRANGDRITILTLSSGAQGGNSAARERESRRAADLLGATLRLAKLPDTRIAEGGPTIEAIGRAFDECGPDVVYTHSLQDNHQDHRNTHRATMVAARGASTVLCYQSPSATIDFRPARFTEIGEYLEAKLDLLSAYGSQVEARPYLADSLIEATALYWGRYAGYGCVEAFEVIRSGQ
jgi:LmbE family N-acetylglucosaminyl deacetylase